MRGDLLDLVLLGACLLFAVVGIFRPALSSVLAAHSIKMMGPTLSSVRDNG